jgi:hypothetical protein
MSVVIPASVKVVGEACFQDCKVLACVTFESGSALERIGACAFQRTSLQSIVHPTTVIFLGDWCFENIGALGSLTFENGSILKHTGEFSLTWTGLKKLILQAFFSIRCRFDPASNPSDSSQVQR